MENRITVREAITEIEIAAFWEQLYNYYKRDIFPDSVDGEQNHFLGGRISTTYGDNSQKATRSLLLPAFLSE